MYTIANVIYGVPVEIDFDQYYRPVEKDLKAGETYEREFANCFENGQEGFLHYYSGSADMPPMAFGIELCRFDECETVDVAQLILKANEEIINEYNDNFSKQTEHVQAQLKQFGNPKVFILWSTS